MTFSLPFKKPTPIKMDRKIKHRLKRKKGEYATATISDRLALLFDSSNVSWHKHMKKIIGNAFSLQMLMDTLATINVAPVQKEDIPFNECESAIGHQDLADHLGVPMNRVNTKLNVNDTLYVAQFMGGRLPEGTSMLEAEQMGMIQFFQITVQYPAYDWYAEQMLDNLYDYA